MASKMTIAVVN